jgi:hypothetical protein
LHCFAIEPILLLLHLHLPHLHLSKLDCNFKWYFCPRNIIQMLVDLSTGIVTHNSMISSRFILFYRTMSFLGLPRSGNNT